MVGEEVPGKLSPESFLRAERMLNPLNWLSSTASCWGQQQCPGVADDEQKQRLSEGKEIKE